MENYKIDRKKIISFIFYLLLVVLLSLVIKNLTSTIFKDITLAFLSKLGLFLFSLMAIIFIRDLLNYRKTVNQVIRNFLQFFYYLLLMSLTFSIAFQNKIEISLFIFLALIVVWIFYSFEEKLEIDTNQNEHSDLPIKSFNELFPTRKKEFIRIYNFISELDVYDPYALAISAAWGEGKTSFVNAIIEKLKIDSNEVIFVQPMIMETREKLLYYVFGQLENIMNNHEIYTGKGSPYQRYFNLLLKFVGNNKNINNLANFFDVFPEDKKADLRDTKEELEVNLQKLIEIKKRIIIIIDDLDRVEEETIYSTLTFIKEIVDLKGVIVLFIVDYDKILSERISTSYLEKFINTKFELKKIDKAEIFNYYFEILIPTYSNTFISNEIQGLKENYNDYLLEILTTIQNWIENEIKKLNENKELETQQKLVDRSKLEELNESFLDLTDKLCNPRYIKKIVSGIRESFNFIKLDLLNTNSNIFLENEEIKINHLIFKINIFKVVFREVYKKIVLSGRIEDFINDNSDIFVQSFFKETKKDFLILENEQIIRDMKYNFYNSLIYSDSISNEIFSKIKTENERLLERIDSKEEIDTEQWDIINLKKMYTAINYSAESVDIQVLTKRINTFTDITLALATQKKINLVQIFELLSKSSSNILIKYPIYLEKILKYISTPNVEFLNAKEKTTSEYYIKEIELPIIFDIMGHMQIICWLYMFEDEKFTYGNLKDSFNDVTSLKGLNELLVIHFKGLNENDHPKNSIECFIEIYKILREKIFLIHKNNTDILESFGYYNEKVERFINIYILMNKLSDQLSKVPIISTNRFEIQSGITSEKEILNKIDQLYNYLEESQDLVEYNHFSYFQSILNDIGWLNKPILDEENYKKIEQSYNILKIKFNKNITLFDFNRWYYCQIKFAEVKKKFVLNERTNFSYTGKDELTVSGKDTIPPTVPKVTRVTSRAKLITGKAEANSNVVVYQGSKKIASTIVNSKGEFKLTLKPVKKNTKLTVYAYYVSENKSEAITITVK